MSTPSREKYPVELSISPVVSSALGEEVALYFLTGAMDALQAETLTERMPAGLASVFSARGVTVLSALVSGKQLRDLQEKFRDSSKSWRGRYYAVTNEFMEVSEAALGQRV